MTLTSAISLRAAFSVRAILASSVLASVTDIVRGTSATRSTNMSAPARIARRFLIANRSRSIGDRAAVLAPDAVTAAAFGVDAGRSGWRASSNDSLTDGLTLASVSCLNAFTVMAHPCWTISIDTRRPVFKDRHVSQYDAQHETRHDGGEGEVNGYSPPMGSSSRCGNHHVPRIATSATRLEYPSLRWWYAFA